MSICPSSHPAHGPQVSCGALGRYWKAPLWCFLGLMSPPGLSPTRPSSVSQSPLSFSPLPFLPTPTHSQTQSRPVRGDLWRLSPHGPAQTQQPSCHSKEAWTHSHYRFWGALLLRSSGVSSVHPQKPEGGSAPWRLGGGQRVVTSVDLWLPPKRVMVSQGRTMTSLSRCKLTPTQVLGNLF